MLFSEIGKYYGHYFPISLNNITNASSNRLLNTKTMMTITKFLSFTTLISTVTNSCAFTPVSTKSHLSLLTSSSTELNIAKELDGMIGSDIENGNKPVSDLFCLAFADSSF